MTDPVNNVKTTSPVTREPRQSGKQDSRAADGAAQAGEAARVTLSAPPAPPPATDRIRDLPAARQTLDRLQQQIAANPAAALAGHRALAPDNTAGLLRSVA